MAEEVEHCSTLDDPFHSQSNSFEQMLQFPAAVAEGANVADWAHGDIEQASRIKERLRIQLCCYNVGVRSIARSDFVSGDQVFHAGVDRVFAADPIEAEAEEHFLQILAAVERCREAAGCAEAIGFDAQPIF